MAERHPSVADASPAAHTALIGLRGSGKSTVGALLASRLRLPFIDLDEKTLALLNARRGASDPEPNIARAWARWGEPEFRKAEARALETALLSSPTVLALGGGTPTAPGAESLLRTMTRSGRLRIVYLQARPDVLRQRLGAGLAARTGAVAASAAPVAGASGAPTDPQRPSLTGKNFLAEIEDVLRAREPLYIALATATVDANTDAETCATAVLAALGTR